MSVSANTVAVKNLSDEDLMELFQNDNELAFKELVQRYKNRLHNFLFRYTRNQEDCEDLVQETFLRVYKSRDTYKRIARFSTWMYTIAINLAKSLYKKKKRMPKVSIHEDPSDPDSFEMKLEDPDLLQDDKLHQNLCMEQLEQALLQVSDDFREVVILRDLQQLSYEEVCEITGLPMGTVKSRINRGRAQLQELLKSYIYQSGTFSA